MQIDLVGKTPPRWEPDCGYMCRWKLHEYSDTFNYTWVSITSSQKDEEGELFDFFCTHKNRLKTNTLPCSYEEAIVTSWEEQWEPMF